MSEANLIPRKSLKYTEIDVDELLDQQLFGVNSSEIVLVYRLTQNRNLRRDIGRLCFLERDQTNPRNVLINPQSFSPQRESALSKRIFDLAALNPDVMLYAINFLDWIDKSRRNWNIESHKDMKEAYFEYTNYLVDRTRQSKVRKNSNTISTLHSSRAQKGARDFIAIFVPRVSESEVKTWAVRLSKKNTKLMNPKLSNDEFSRKFAILVRVFDQLTDFILGSQEWPLKLSMKGLGFPYNEILIAGDFMDSFTHDTPDKQGYWVLRDGRLRTFKEFSHEITGLSRSERHKFSARLREFFYSNASDDRKGVYVAPNATVQAYCNTAVYLFSLAVVADSGANFSVLNTLDWEENENIKDLNKTRIVGRKHRANGKVQDVSVSPRFQPYFRKYLRLRKYMGCDGKKGTWLFNKNTKKLVQLPIKAEMDAFHKRLFRLLKVPVKIPGPRDWRWNVSYEYLNASDGNVELVSRILGNTTDTVRKHYGYGTFENSAVELEDFFAQLMAFSKEKTRVDDRLIPVVVDQEAPKTLTGGCRGQEIGDASLADGFTDAVTKPDCGVPVTCFLCSFYAIHIDFDDFLKILSAKEWLKMQGEQVSRNHDEYLAKYEPIIHRIDEILLQASEVDHESKRAFEMAAERVERGDYDTYWKIQIDALIESGAAL